MENQSMNANLCIQFDENEENQVMHDSHKLVNIEQT